jgi:hypothetical protein
MQYDCVPRVIFVGRLPVGKEFAALCALLRIEPTSPTEAVGRLIDVFG